MNLNTKKLPQKSTAVTIDGRRGNASLTVPGKLGQHRYCRERFIHLYADAPHGRWFAGWNVPSRHKVSDKLTHIAPPFFLMMGSITGRQVLPDLKEQNPGATHLNCSHQFRKKHTGFCL